MLGSLFSSQRRLRKAQIPALALVTPSPLHQAWKALRRNRMAMFSLILLVAMALWCIFGPMFSPWRDEATDALMINKAPNAQHWLGTDFLGRDIYTSSGRLGIVIIKSATRIITLSVMPPT